MWRYCPFCFAKGPQTSHHYAASDCNVIALVVNWYKYFHDMKIYICVLIITLLVRVMMKRPKFQRQRYLLQQWINVGAQPRSPDCKLSHSYCRTDVIAMIQMMTTKYIFVFIGILEIAVRLRRWRPHPLISFKQSSRRRPMIQPARGKLAKSI